MLASEKNHVGIAFIIGVLVGAIAVWTAVQAKGLRVKGDEGPEGYRRDAVAEITKIKDCIKKRLLEGAEGASPEFFDEYYTFGHSMWGEKLHSVEIGKRVLDRYVIDTHYAAGVSQECIYSNWTGEYTKSPDDGEGPDVDFRFEIVETW